MDAATLEQTIARIDAALRPIATRPIDASDPGWVERMRARPAPVDEAGVRDEAHQVLRAVLDLYAAGDEAGRAMVRGWFSRYPSFTWAVQLPHPASFRDHLLHLSARDQFPDTRDELLTLRDLCAAATSAGTDIGPVLTEVAHRSSTVDRYGMGSTRELLLSCVPAPRDRHTSPSPPG